MVGGIDVPRTMEYLVMADLWPPSSKDSVFMKMCRFLSLRMLWGIC
jgi:hypothetical protein